MKLLFLAPYSPAPPVFGGGIRLFHLMRESARLGHEVHLAAFFDDWHDRPEHRAMIDEFCASVRRLGRGHGDRGKRWRQLKGLVGPHAYQYYQYFHPGLQRLLDEACAEVRPHAVVVENSQMGYYAIPAGPLKVMDTQNVEYRLIERSAEAAGWSVRRVFNEVEARKFRRDEARMLAGFDLVFATSAKDAREFKDLIGGRCPPLDVVVNGVDTRHFEFKPGGGNGRRLVYTGAMHYFPNVDAARWMADEILPLVRAKMPDAGFFAVGGAPTEDFKAWGRRHGTEVTGFVDDVRPWLYGADVVVVPLRAGSGTRLKVVEALACGRPVVATPVGCEGIAVEDGVHLLVADGPRAFADAVVRLLEDRGLAARLAEAGRRLVEERYDWRSVARGMCGAIEAALSRTELQSEVT